jgi:hypothetical protein
MIIVEGKSPEGGKSMHLGKAGDKTFEGFPDIGSLAEWHERHGLTGDGQQ